ncbi:MAG: hypothetical protein ACE5D6_02850 [Candidatus Zixiibacteriota bacterium]
MKTIKFASLLLIIFTLGIIKFVFAQNSEGIDPNAIIERILAVDEEQRAKIKDITFDAEYIEGKKEDDGSFKEKEKFIKKIYLKYLADTVFYHEKYLEYYKEGKWQEQKKLDKEASKRIEKKKKRKRRDISYNMLKPFYTEQSTLYEIKYLGVAEENIEEYVCHHFKVAANEENDTLINGEYYFDAESFHLVRVDFSPAKLVKKTLFRLKEMRMSLIYGPTEDGFWLPRQFDIQGKGKAMFFIGVKFAGVEYYRNPVVNSNIGYEIFEVNNGK